MQKGTHHSEETKKKISEIKKGKNLWSDEVRKQIMESRKKSQRYREKHHLWKGGRYLKHGYVWILTDEKYGSNGRGGHKKYKLEHRVVMEKTLGRKLEKWEEVHHKNGIKTDNRIENLEVVPNIKHFGTVRCPHCLNHFKIK